MRLLKKTKKRVVRYQYDRGKPIFPKNEVGDEMYLCTDDGDEVYPPKGPYPFAHDRFAQPFYAKTAKNHEFYPTRHGYSVLINNYDQPAPVLAVYASGKQRYPTNSKGHEYYLRGNDDEPFLLRDESGRPYFARTRNGVAMIPAKFFYDCRDTTQKYYMGLDAAKNVVYSEGKRLITCQSKVKRFLFTCLCSQILNIPPLVCVILSALKL